MSGEAWRQSVLLCCEGWGGGVKVSYFDILDSSSWGTVSLPPTRWDRDVAVGED